MFEYDATLKLSLRGSAAATIQALSGLTIDRWLNVEVPNVESLRVDLLGESADGTLLHIELQSSNQPSMARRMLEYGVAIMRRYDRYPEQSCCMSARIDRR